jgi:hypothetical protein
MIAQNHEAFMTKISRIKDKKEQMQLMKTYWASFPPEEFIAFMSSNMAEIGTGLEALVTSDSLSESDKKHINTAFDKGILLTKKMKNAIVGQPTSL